MAGLAARPCRVKAAGTDISMSKRDYYEILGVSRPSLYDLLGRFGLKKENGL